MIRTAILAGLFLVMLSIAYTRIDLPPIPVRDTSLITEPPPVEPTLPSEAAKPLPKRIAAAHPARPHVEAPKVEEASVEEAAVEEPAVAEPVKIHEPPAPLPAPARVAAIAPVAPAPAPPVATAPVSLLPPQEPVAPKVAAAEPSAVQAPVPLIPPAAAPQAPIEKEVPAPVVASAVEKQPTITKAEDMPLIQVPQRPIVAPWEAPKGTTHNSGAALATVGTTQPAADAPKFMTPQERSRELYRLARDMEDLFITKLTH